MPRYYMEKKTYDDLCDFLGNLEAYFKYLAVLHGKTTKTADEYRKRITSIRCRLLRCPDDQAKRASR